MSTVPGLQFPWFTATRSNDGFVVNGDQHVSLGHRIGRPDSSSPDGIFGEWSWDGAGLVARNDRYGIYPLFYSATDDSVAISTSPLQLIAQGVSPELDEDALSVLFSIGCFVGDDTPFRRIKVLSPDAVLRWRAGDLELERHRPRPPVATNIDLNAAVATFAELFAQSIARRLPADDEVSVVPLSGGRDSRHIFLELVKQGRPPSFSMTHGRTPASPRDDLPVARQLVEAHGLDHLVLNRPMPPSGALSLYNTLVHFSSAVSAPFLISDMLGLWGRAAIAYEGLGGDSLGQTSARHEALRTAFRDGQLDDLPDLLFAHFGYDCLDGLLPRSINRGRARERLRPILEEAAAAPNPWQWFNFWQRGRRRYSPGHLVLSHAVPTVVVPYLDHDLVDFALSVPSGLHDGHDFHDRVLAHAYPDSVDVSFSSAPPVPTASERLRMIRQVSGFAARHHRKRLSSVAGWAGRRLVGRRLCPPPHIVQYLLQVEAVTKPGEAARQLDAAARLTTFVPESRGTMLSPGDALPV